MPNLDDTDKDKVFGAVYLTIPIGISQCETLPKTTFQYILTVL